jgi:hypothetical protein
MLAVPSANVAASRTSSRTPSPSRSGHENPAMSSSEAPNSAVGSANPTVWSAPVPAVPAKPPIEVPWLRATT